MPPAKPKLASIQAAAATVKQWDVFVAEASKDMQPYQMALPDGEVVDVPCPSSDQMDALGEAQGRGDTVAMMVAVFGDLAPKVMDLTGKLPFPVRLRLIGDVMMHYGMNAANLPES